MRNTKIKERFENAVDAFFDNEKLSENSSLGFADKQNIWQKDSSVNFGEKTNTLVKILKQVFLFFPGTFLLFIISFAFTVISINNPFNAALFEGSAFWMIFWFLTSIFMTWFGLGEIRKPKHFVIPASIITTGVIVGAVGGIISLIFHQFERLLFSDAYPLYFFPLALMLPFLAKGLIERESKDG
jgi:hypothetical protein